MILIVPAWRSTLPGLCISFGQYPLRYQATRAVNRYPGWLSRLIDKLTKVIAINRFFRIGYRDYWRLIAIGEMAIAIIWPIIDINREGKAQSARPPKTAGLAVQREKSINRPLWESNLRPFGYRSSEFPLHQEASEPNKIIARLLRYRHCLSRLIAKSEFVIDYRCSAKICNRSIFDFRLSRLSTRAEYRLTALVTTQNGPYCMPSLLWQNRRGVKTLL